MDRALEIARDHGGAPGEVRSRRGGEGEDAVGAWRGAFLLAPYLRDTFVACGVLSETFETAITWDRFEEFHATVMETTRARGRRGQRRPGRRPRRAARQLPLHPRLSRRRRALLHRPRPGGPRRRGRAVGRDQGRRLRGADRRRRHDHPPPRGRPRPPPLVRPPAPGPLRRRPARRQGRARPGRDAQPRRPDRPLTTLCVCPRSRRPSSADDHGVPTRNRGVASSAKTARPLAVNLAEGLALSEFLSAFTGSARRT